MTQPTDIYFKGAPNIASGDYFKGILLLPLLIGLFWLARGFWRASRQRIEITATRVTIEQGWMHKRVRSIELFQILSLSHRRVLWREALELKARVDGEFVNLVLTLPRSGEVFRKLHVALPNARAHAHVEVRINMPVASSARG